MFECLTKLKKVFQGPTDKNICPVRAPKKKMLALDVWRWIGPAPDRWTPGNRWTVDRPLSHFSLFTCLWGASFDWNFTWLNFKCNSIRWARAFSADFQDEKISRPLAVKIWICRSLSVYLDASLPAAQGDWFRSWPAETPKFASNHLVFVSKVKFDLIHLKNLNALAVVVTF